MFLGIRNIHYQLAFKLSLFLTPHLFHLWEIKSIAIALRTPHQNSDHELLLRSRKLCSTNNSQSVQSKTFCNELFGRNVLSSHLEFVTDLKHRNNIEQELSDTECHYVILYMGLLDDLGFSIFRLFDKFFYIL